MESFDLQNKLGKKLKENGWFVGFAPRRNPEIVVAALVQGGGWGSTSAAPIVRDVVKAYYDKKSGKKDLTYTAKDGEARDRADLRKRSHRVQAAARAGEI